MDKRFILVADHAWVLGKLDNPKFRRKWWFPLGSEALWQQRETQVLLRFRSVNGALTIDSSPKIVVRSDGYYLQSRPLVEDFLQHRGPRSHVFILVEGSPKDVRIVMSHDDGNLLQDLQVDDPTLRLHAYSLPPTTVTTVDTPAVMRAIYLALRSRDSELYSRRTDEFIRSPHILLTLLSHVMDLRSRDQIDFVANLRVIVDQFRDLLKDRIRKLDKSHQRLWAEWAGERISFVDGGVAQISGLPGSEPMAIRVGVYTVIPGEENPDSREVWSMHPYIPGDILSVPADPDQEDADPPNGKRLQEAARYILEALTVLRHLATDARPRVVFLHGPLVNAFETYDEGPPYFIRAIDPAFLHAHGITEQDVIACVDSIPPRRDGRKMWNQCMAIYGYLMKTIFNHHVPVVGVVERSRSNAFIKALLQRLRDEGVIVATHARKLRARLDQYRITDELLLGCVLDEGEYIDPMPLPKNLVHRARDRWQPVVAQYPIPTTSYLKTSSSSFPYRVEFNRQDATLDVREIMDLLYHTSRLLPEYAFPVGLDIADRFARIPDWLSKGVSASIAAQVLARAAATGEPRLVQQVRRFLAGSPRDFFFRPRVRS